MKDLTHIRITRGKYAVKKVEVDDGYGKVIELPTTGFEYHHEANDVGVVKIGVFSHRVYFYEDSA